MCKATLSHCPSLQTAQGRLHGGDLCGSSGIWKVDCTDHGETLISKDVFWEQPISGTNMLTGALASVSGPYQCQAHYYGSCVANAASPLMVRKTAMAHLMSFAGGDSWDGDLRKCCCAWHAHTVPWACLLPYELLGCTRPPSQPLLGATANSVLPQEAA